MSIHIYNSLTRAKAALVPLKPGNVRMYVCGMTVYDYCHLGHARVLVVFDMVVRVLRSRGLDVEYVRNITDIDDKIIARAAEVGEPFEALTSRFIEAMHEDEALLNVLPPDVEPRATGYIREMIAMIETLEKKGFAYAAENGDVYFRVHQFPGYGTLSGRSLDSLLAGARVEKDEAKEDPLDFVLWKAAKPAEPQWPSPWGPGRPGWHIECSAMSRRCLGDSFDIHGGGMDLRFPHHENEIAQSEGTTGKKFVATWMHNGYVQIEQEKMSKSLGNFLTIREIVGESADRARTGEVIRFMILLSHYRSPLNFSHAGLSRARAGIERLYQVIHRCEGLARSPAEDISEDYRSRFDEALNDDFNTAAAIAVLFEIARDANRDLERGEKSLAAFRAFQLGELAQILGLLYQKPERFLGITGGINDEGFQEAAAAVESLIEQRAQARRDSDFEAADAIRGTLESRGVVLEDLPDGTTSWRQT
ncbi:MAG TPA: cysteine--tRNA ligase [Arenicellales bacterium]|nr:cysteine--tRNA ligase [Arenicellales bacterium]